MFHRFERVAFGWDMQFDHVLRPAIRMGLDGVFSDHVDVMVDALAAEYVPAGRRSISARGSSDQDISSVFRSFFEIRMICGRVPTLYR